MFLTKSQADVDDYLMDSVFLHYSVSMVAESKSVLSERNPNYREQYHITNESTCNCMFE